MIVPHATTSANPRIRMYRVLRFIDCEIVTDSLRLRDGDIVAASVLEGLIGSSVIKPSRPASGCEERIVTFFLTDGAQRTVPAGEHRVAGQAQDPLDVVPVLVGEMIAASAD